MFFLHLILSTDGAWVINPNIRVKSGSPGIIPCLYKEQYKEHQKFWCWGTFWSTCSILAYVNGTRNKFSITDYPAQSIFTVEWQNLQPSDSAYYWCAVEIGGPGTLDAGYFLYLTVQSAPDVSVKSSSVSGHEGGNVSVQCLYRSGYKTYNKQWCRVKDKSCFTEEKTDTSQNLSVQISDDGKSFFTVLMTGLNLSDSGWYFCSVGDLQVPVQLTVTKPEPKVLTTPKYTSETEMNTTQLSNNTTSTIMHSTINKGEQIKKEERVDSSTMNTMPSENQMTSISPAEADSSADDPSVLYSPVSFTKKRLSSVDPEPDVVYSTVMKDRKTVSS
nr:CMRF35-like molecule 3 [Danio rerio]|eukprot:XP_021322078.1 CMRF35-like molecule 3 [Danio rerio]